MFSPKRIGIIGDQSAMVQRHLLPLLKGYEVVGTDKQTIRDAEELNARICSITAECDVVFFFLPIKQVKPVMLMAVGAAKSKALWVHGTSIQNPVSAPIASLGENEFFRRRSIQIVGTHIMASPAVRSLRGVAVLIAAEAESEQVLWLKAILGSTRARVFFETPESHDEKTKGAQLIPMVGNLLRLEAARRCGVDLAETLSLAGAPALLGYISDLRTAEGRGVAAQIIAEHPSSEAVANAYLNAALNLLAMVKVRNSGAIERIFEGSLILVEEEALTKIRDLTDRVVLVLGDLRGGAVGFRFDLAKDRVGLLRDVLNEFDVRGLDKTTTLAQARETIEFFVGVSELEDPRIVQVVRRVNEEFAAEVIENAFAL